MEIKDLRIAFLEGYICAKLTEALISGKVKSSDLDKVKGMAVKCMEESTLDIRILHMKRKRK